MQCSFPVFQWRVCGCCSNSFLAPCRLKWSHHLGIIVWFLPWNIWMLRTVISSFNLNSLQRYQRSFQLYKRIAFIFDPRRFTSTPRIDGWDPGGPLSTWTGTSWLPFQSFWIEAISDIDIMRINSWFWIMDSLCFIIVWVLKRVN